MKNSALLMACLFVGLVACDKSSDLGPSRPQAKAGTLLLTKAEGSPVDGIAAWTMIAGSSGNVRIQVRDAAMAPTAWSEMTQSALPEEVRFSTVGESGGYIDFGIRDGEALGIELRHQVVKAEKLLKAEWKQLFGPEVIETLKREHPRAAAQSLLSVQVRVIRDGARPTPDWVSLGSHRLPEELNSEFNHLNFEGRVDTGKRPVFGTWQFLGAQAIQDGANFAGWKSSNLGLELTDSEVDAKRPGTAFLVLELQFLAR